MKNPNTTTYDRPTYPQKAAQRIAALEAERDTLQAQLTELRDDVSDWRAHLVAFTFAADPAESGWKESAQEIADEMATHPNPPKENKQ